MTRLATAHVPIGALDRLFVLETPLETPDGFGGVIRAHAAGPQLWGAIRALSARRAREPGGATHQVTLRRREGVDDRARLRLGARRFLIRSAEDPDGRRGRLVCLVEEIAP
jgi:head-tail adaptor